MKKISRRDFLKVAGVSAAAMGLAACGGSGSTSQAAGSTAASVAGSAAQTAANGKVGLISATTAISEEQYTTAQSWLEQLGADRCTVITYPDNFMSEEETTISNLLNLIADPEIKAIIFMEGIPGASAAVMAAKDVRDDVLYMQCGADEDPDVFEGVFDVTLMFDDWGAGVSYAERAKEMGAETIIYYSFPRHQGYAKVYYSGTHMEARAAELGMQFIRVTMPDPQSDAGTAGTQQFCIEDVPKEIAAYGPKTAFFDTNTMSTPAVIKALYDAGEGIYMNPSQSSPFCGYPESLGISVPEDKSNDYLWMIEAIRDKLAETNDNGRFSTRTIPNTVMLNNTAVRYALKWIDGEFTDKVDAAAMQATFNEVTDNSDSTTFCTYDIEGVQYDDCFLVTSGFSTL